MDDNILLSVVIISRNTEKYIERCLESVIKAASGIKNEIILVDSASTDRTVERAKKYPIKILQIKDTRFLSASGGRYIGFQHTRGRFIYFFDADSLLDSEWFEKALPLLKKDPMLGGVMGYISQEYYDNYTVKNWIDVSNNEKPGDIQWFYADILLKRDVLKQVGNFNPWLKSMEEGELSYRILNAGYKLSRLPYNMAKHLGGEDETSFSFVKRKIENAVSLGRIIRYSIRDKEILKRHIRDSKFIIIMAIILSGALLYLPLMYFVGLQQLFLFAPMFLILTYFWIIVEKKPLSTALFHIINITLLWPFTLMGLLKNPIEPEKYPLAVEKMKV